MWFTLSEPFGLLAWLGWFAAPHITMVYFSYALYWKTNPELCVLAALAVFVSHEIDLEKRAAMRVGKAVSEHWDDIKPFIAWPAATVGLFVITLVFLRGVLRLILGIPTSNAILTFVPLVFVIGWVLYSFRQKRKRMYGVLEIISGLLLAGYSIAHWSVKELLGRSDSFAILLGLLSSVYVVVRGFDNMAADSITAVIKKTVSNSKLIVTGIIKKRQQPK